MSTDIHTPGDGPGFFDRTLDVLRRGEAEDIFAQTRVGGELTGTVRRAGIDWSRMPTHVVCAWQMGTTDESALYGWGIPVDGTGTTAIAGTRSIARPFPDRAGYRREYRLFAGFAHSPGSSETAWRVMLKLDTVAINVVSTTVTTHAVDLSSGWLPSSVLDGWSAGGSDTPVGVVLLGGTDWAAVSPGVVTCRAALLEGRYVKS